jgi:transketolase
MVFSIELEIEAVKKAVIRNYLNYGVCEFGMSAIFITVIDAKSLSSPTEKEGSVQLQLSFSL